MRQGLTVLVVFVLLALAPFSQVTAKDDGIYNRSNGCGCHSNSGSVTAQLTGLPTAYTPGTSYGLTVAMSTTPNTGGFNLEVSKGALSNPDSNTQVSSNGFQATHGFSPGTTTWTMDWTAPASGSGSVQFDLAVLAANGNGGTSGDAYNTLSTSVSEDINANTPPTASNLIITPAAPNTADALTVSYTYSDDDGDAESGTTVAWHLNGVVQTGQTSSTLPSSATSKGESWQAVVTPSDGEDAGTPVTSSSVIIANSAPEVTSIEVSDETPDTNEAVTFTYQTGDADGDAITATEFRWLLEGAPVASLDNASTLPAVATRAGDVWTVEVRITDGEDMSDWLASADVVVGSSNQPPTVDTVTLSPASATTLDDLTASWTASDPDGDAVMETELTWMKDGVHQPEVDDVNPLPSERTSKGEVWTASVRASDGAAWSPATSSSQQTIANAAPVASNATLESPTYSGLDPLTVNFTTEDPDGDAVELVDVRWYLNDVEQNDGAGSLVLEAGILQRGDAWHAVITVGDGADQTVITTGTVLIVNAAPEVNITWPSEPTALIDLMPLLSVTDVDGDETTFATTWYKNGFRDASLTNATSVGAEKLAPGQEWKVMVVASDGDKMNSNEAMIVIANLQPSAAITVVSSAVWFNETTLLSAETSTDADGELVHYTWSWDGTSATGSTVAVVLTEDTEIRLVVTDENGATAESTLLLDVTAGPSVQNLQVSDDANGHVDLTWTWLGGAVEFNILRNGELVGTTDDLAYQDQPPMSGANAYTIQPVNEERIFLNGADEVSTTLQPIVVEEPGPASGLGYGLGALMLLALLMPPVLGSRKGGGV